MLSIIYLITLMSNVVILFVAVLMLTVIVMSDIKLCFLS
jgi:hypothetical protein